MVSESINLLDRKSFGGNIGLKLDIHKAFETLEWDFLFQVLNNFGFSTQFSSWIRTLLDSARLSVIINGSPHGFFSCLRGVRQGDPLSPLLFCLAEEALSRGILHLRSTGLVKYISTPRGCSPPSHALYADDVFIFSRGDVHSLKNLMVFLKSYGKASGQNISLEKSSFFCGRYAASRKSIIQSILGCNEGDFPFTYLGVPISSKDNLNDVTFKV